MTRCSSQGPVREHGSESGSGCLGVVGGGTDSFMLMIEWRHRPELDSLVNPRSFHRRRQISHLDEGVGTDRESKYITERDRAADILGSRHYPSPWLHTEQ